MMWGLASWEICGQKNLNGIREESPKLASLWPSAADQGQTTGHCTEGTQDTDRGSP